MNKSSNFIETPEMMRARRLTQKALRGKLGDPISEDKLEEAWQHLTTSERNRLRLSQFFNIMAKPVTKDLTNIYINLAFTAITLVPGPTGIFVIPALAASYAVRWDKRAREARRKILDLAKNDVTLEQYHDVIKLYQGKTYKLDKHALIQKKIKSITRSAQEVREAAKEHIPAIYNKAFINPGKKLGALLQNILSKAVGTKCAEKALKPLFNQTSRIERATIANIISKGKKADDFIKKTGSNLKEIFSTAVETKEQLGEAVFYGWEYNKRQIKNALQPYR